MYKYGFLKNGNPDKESLKIYFKKTLVCLLSLRRVQAVNLLFMYTLPQSDKLQFFSICPRWRGLGGGKLNSVLRSLSNYKPKIVVLHYNVKKSKK